MPKELDKTSEAFLTKENETLKTFIRESEQKVADMNMRLETYENFISPDDFEVVASHLESAVAYSELGTLEEVKESVSKLASFEALATLEEIEQAIVMIESYKALGSLEELESAKLAAESFEGLATVEEVEKALETLATYANCGFTTEDAVAMVENKKAEESALVIAGIASACKVSESIASKTLELHNGDVEATESYLNQFTKTEEKIEVKESVDPLIDAKIEKIVETVTSKSLTMLKDFK